MKNNITRFYKIDPDGQKNRYELDALVREFIRPEEFIFTDDEKYDTLYPAKIAALEERGAVSKVLIKLPERGMERNAAKRFIYDKFSEFTGYSPEWGTLTGVRPAKLVNELMAKEGLSYEEAAGVLRKVYYINEEKISLLLETCRNQSFLTGTSAGRSAGVYIGIPFCPTRCLYCSFTSNQAEEEAVEKYLGALFSEIEYVGKRLGGLNVDIESMYIGGGTPTSLSAEQLDRLLSHINTFFNLKNAAEFCAEAGRPDTITEEKLSVLKSHGVNRISINPQTMNEETLKIIGRSHSVEDIYQAFGMAEKSGIPLVNTDIIAGLPGEDFGMFMHTLNEVINLAPANITVHTLAVKRASRLIEKDADYHYRRDTDAGRMVSEARKILADNGYYPYYMYRQKHMTGNFENVSYAKKGTESVYNIRIMDEHQSIIALGAGGISKAYYERENRLERVPNVSNYQVYIDRIDEMIKRKEDKLYLPFEA